MRENTDACSTRGAEHRRRVDGLADVHPGRFGEACERCIDGEWEQRADALQRTPVSRAALGMCCVRDGT
jgi:hypothetical protein